jgi:hypothetical protein
MDNQPKAVSRMIKVNKEMTIKVEPFRKQWYLAARYMWTTPDGELAFDRNGINMPLDVALPVIQNMIEVYNEAMDTNYTLASGTDDEEL